MTESDKIRADILAALDLEGYTYEEKLSVIRGVVTNNDRRNAYREYVEATVEALPD